MKPFPSPAGAIERTGLAGLNRRDFLIGSIKASLAFLAYDALGRPSFARDGREISLTRIPSLDDSLQVVAAYLARYTPPSGHFPTEGPWKARYDLIEWEGSPIDAAFVRRNRVIGNLALTRHPDAPDAGPSYAADQVIRMQGFESAIRSSMQCSADPLPRLRTWRTRYSYYPVGRPEAATGLNEEGSCRDGMMETVSAAGTRRLRTELPVTTQWAILDTLRGARAAPSEARTEMEFDLFHDLTSHRPQQRLAPCGLLDLRLGDARHFLHGYVQTGRGTEPTHYWIDDAGRPLLVTAGLLSMALTAVQT